MEESSSKGLLVSSHGTANRGSQNPHQSARRNAREAHQDVSGMHER